MAHGRETPELPGVGGHHGGTRSGGVSGMSPVPRGRCQSHVLDPSPGSPLLAPTPPATAPPGISTPGTSLLRQARDLSAHVRCPWIPHGGGSAADYRCGDAGLLLPEVDLSVRQGPGSLLV